MGEGLDDTDGRKRETSCARKNPCRVLTVQYAEARIMGFPKLYKFKNKLENGGG